MQQLGPLPLYPDDPARLGAPVLVGAEGVPLQACRPVVVAAAGVAADGQLGLLELAHLLAEGDEAPRPRHLPLQLEEGVVVGDAGVQYEPSREEEVLDLIGLPEAAALPGVELEPEVYLAGLVVVEVVCGGEDEVGGDEGAGALPELLGVLPSLEGERPDVAVQGLAHVLRGTLKSWSFPKTTSLV